MQEKGKSKLVHRGLKRKIMETLYRLWPERAGTCCGKLFGCLSLVVGVDEELTAAWWHVNDPGTTVAAVIHPYHLRKGILLKTSELSEFLCLVEILDRQYWEVTETPLLSNF